MIFMKEKQIIEIIFLTFWIATRKDTHRKFEPTICLVAYCKPNLIIAGWTNFDSLEFSWICQLKKTVFYSSYDVMGSFSRVRV